MNPTIHNSGGVPEERYSPATNAALIVSTQWIGTCQSQLKKLPIMPLTG